jgi:tRNA (guanosine-2'-O-)-methyltransferase
MRQVLGQRLAHVHCAVEAVYHRHNVSAILRTCDALGVHVVHLVGVGDLRVSKGPARGAERWLDVRHHESAEAALSWLSAAGVSVWVADLADEAVTPEGVPLGGPVCLWFGAELVGVSDTARAAAAGVVTIPMRGMAQSLNVSVAAALGLRAVAERARALGRPAFLSDEVVAATLAGWVQRDEDTALRLVGPR